MAPALARLRREHPGVQVDLKLVDPEDPLPEVKQGRADLAIVVRPRDPIREGVRLVHLLDDPYRAVLPKGHRLAAKRVLDLTDLADEPWVGSHGPPGPCLDAVLDACAAAGFTPNFVVETEDYATAQGFVAAGLGIGLIPSLGLGLGLGQGTPHPAVAVRKVRNPEPSRAIFAALREPSLTQPALRSLLDALRDAATR